MAKTAISPDQASLFVENEQTGVLHPELSGVSQPSIPDADPQHDSVPGPSVNILERNAHMQNMLRRLGEMSRTSGLQIASDTGFRRDLEARYDNVDTVVGNAVERSGQKNRESKQEYAKAFGLEAIVASGLTSEEDAKAMAARSYGQEVLPVFADAKGAKRRDGMKRWLNYQERILTGKKTRRPEVSLPKPPEVV